MSKQNIILLFVALAVIIFLGFVLYTQDQVQKAISRSSSMGGNGSNGTNTTEELKTRSTFDSVLSGLIANASNNPLTFETLISALESNGIVVLKEGQVSTLEYNPKRVTIRETMKQCITTPCFNVFEIIKIG